MSHSKNNEVKPHHFEMKTLWLRSVCVYARVCDVCLNPCVALVQHGKITQAPAKAYKLGHCK